MSSPLSHTPSVYEPLKNSSAVNRSSTPSQYGKLALGAAHGRQRRDADADGHKAVERVAQIAGADDLRRIALRRVRRPDIQVVAELRREEPAGERREELLQLDVLPQLHVLRVAEGVDVGRIEAPLIQIARVAEEPEVDLALLAVVEQEPEVGNVLERLLLLGLGARRGWPATNSPLQPSDTQMPVSS